MLGSLDFPELRPITLLMTIACVTGVLGFFVGRVSAVYDASPPARSAATLSEQLPSRKAFGKADDNRPTQPMMQKPGYLSPADRTTSVPLPVVLLNPSAADVAGKGKKAARGLTPETILKGDRVTPSDGRVITMSGLAKSTFNGNAFVEDVPKTGKPDADGELLVSSNGDEFVDGRLLRQADVKRCERRFKSFRGRDGTYQPHDGGPRKLCPHLL